MSRGRWVMVCGPSGAGKDSLLAWTAAQLAAHKRIVFSRRLVTRAAHPGSDHDETSRAAFAALRDGGGLAWHWEAHGTQYGVRAADAALVARGQVVVVNASREHVAGLPRRTDVVRVLVTAGAPVLRQRLLARGREPQAEVDARMERSTQLGPGQADLVIVNEGPLEQAGAQLRDALLELAW